MNKATVIALVGVIVAMPMVYIVFNGIEKPDVFTFRGAPVQMVEPQNGTVIVPTETENQQAVPMRATLKSAFTEKTTGLKPPFADDLVLSINSVSNKVTTCLEDGTIPEQAHFELASTCAPAHFENMKLDRKTLLETDAKEQFIMLGATSNNQIKLYYKKLIATYVSKDMTQGDRKREACIVRIMLDHLLGQPANVEASCPASTG